MTHQTNNNNLKSQNEDEYDEDNDEEDENDDDDVLLTLSVHVSLFHAPSKRFFGNTWVSPEIAIDPFLIKPSRDPKSNALRSVLEGVTLNVRAYFLSEIVDPNCVGIVELVVSRKDPDSKATVAAAGCGWSILPLFAQTIGDATASSLSSAEVVGVFTGSPRVLWEVNTASEWPTLARHEQCKLHYHLEPYEPLLPLGTSGFVRRNELVGALEVIPGLKHGNLAGIDAGTNPKLMLLRDSGSNGSEDEGDDITAYANTLASFARMASLVPRTIELEESFALNVQTLRVFMHMRGEVETNLIARLKLSRRTIHDGATSIDCGHVSARVLKIALHNGRGFRTRQHTIPLKVDENGSSSANGDDNMRCAQATPARLKGFVFHPYMAVVVTLQFTVHFRVTWPPKLKQQAMEAKPMKILPEDDVTTVTMASRVVVPSDGKKLFLHDRQDASTNSHNDRRDERVLHVDLLSGPPCRPYTENPVYTPQGHMIGRSAHATFGESIAFADLVLMMDGQGDKATENKGKPENISEPAAAHWATRMLAKADANSILAKTLNSLAKTTPASSSPRHRPPPPSSPVKCKEERGTSPVRPASPLKVNKSPMQYDPVPIVSPADSTATELSRASKTLLMRSGFVDAHDARDVAATAEMQKSKKLGAVDNIPKSLRPELDDVYKAHEIRLHFAAFRVPPTSSLKKGTTLPTRLYFTFQFYRFAPTRTETLRLSDSFASSSSLPTGSTGQTFLLMRESPAHKPSLAIQYDVDTTLSQNPLEHLEFASYLLNKQLYVDVWDANSLFLLGTCAIPLHELLRQGAGVKKFQGEVDVWENLSSADIGSSPVSNNDDDECVDADARYTDLAEIKQPVRQSSNAAIGKLQILLSNYGLKGRHVITASTTETSSDQKAVNREHRAPPLAATTKAKHRVRARPLVDSNAELYRLLTDQGFYGRNQHGDREDSTRRRHHRQLLQARSAGDATTLTSREVDILCELFRANVQASAPHATRIACDRDGKRGLTALLSLKPPAHQTSQSPPLAVIPPLNIGQAVSSLILPDQDPVAKLRDHVQRVLQRAIDKGVRIHQVFMDFDASRDGNLSLDELERALAQLGVELRPTDAAAQATMRQLLSQFDKDGDGSVSYEEFLLSLGISVEKNTQEVVETTTMDMENAVREVFRRLQSNGMDIEELFDHFDVDKNGSLDMRELHRALDQCLQLDHAQGGKLLAALNEEALRALVERVNQNGDDVVDYHEFLTFCGVVLKTPREDKVKKRALSQAERKLIKLLLRAMRMGMSVKQLFQQFDSNADGEISVREFADSLDALFQAKRSLSEEDIGAITKRFDANGDGNISYAEFKGFVEEIRTAQDYLTKMFTPLLSRGELARDAEIGNTLLLSKWRATCQKQWKLAKTDVDAAVGWMEAVDLVDDKQRINVREFLLVVSPPPVLKQPVEEKKSFGTCLRDFLEHAVREGVDARGCFSHFDPDGDGEITAAELKAALRQLGGAFDDITGDAIDAMVDEIDTDGSGKISFTEFQCLLPAAALAEPPKTSVAEETDTVLVWLSELLATAVAKGLDIDACFQHFDKDGNGTITREEFTLAMKELGMKDVDGDAQLLTRVMDKIDRDRSGEISLVEFKRLFPRSNSSSQSSTPIVTPRDDVSPTEPASERPSSSGGVDRLQDLLRAAEQSGVSIAQSFAHFDVDKDGSITREEFGAMIKALPGFEGIADGEVSEFVVALDANQSGSISLEEFQAFVHGNRIESKAIEPAASTESSEAKEAEVKTSPRPTENEPASGNGSEAPILTEKNDRATSGEGDQEANDTLTAGGDTTTKDTKENAQSEATADKGGKPKLQRAGSFAGPKGRSLKATGRASTDPETVAKEAAKSGRRPTLAETRAAAKAAKAAVTAVKAGGSGDITKADAPSSVIVEAGDEKKTTTAEVSEVLAADALLDYSPGGPQQSASISRRPSLAETRAAARTAAKTSAAPLGKPPMAGGARRPSLAETRAAAAAAKAKATAKPVISSSTSLAMATASGETQHSLASLQTLLQQAQTGGVDLNTALQHFDKDANGKLTYEEFASGLKALGSGLANTSPETARTMAQWIDMAGKGHITVQDFEIFVQTPLTALSTVTSVPPKPSTDPDTTAVPPRTVSQAVKPRSGSLSARVPPRANKPPPVTRSAVSESEAGPSRPPVASVPSKPPTVSVPEKRPQLEGPPGETQDVQRQVAQRVSEAPPPRDDFECGYEYHSDPAIRSVEVKLRRAAIDAYSRGVFPLRLVHKFLDSHTATSTSTQSVKNRSELRRVEFLHLLMEMGFSLLSDQGEEETDDGGAAGVLSGPRMHDQLYARQLERLARYKHHIKQESRAEKTLVRTVQQMQQRAAHRKQKTAMANPSSSVGRFVEDKSQLLRVLSYYRDGHKKALVFSLLRDQVTTQVTLFPSFAALLFAEMEFSNPYPHQERFRLELLSTPLTVDADIVKSTDEWRFYRRHVPLAYGDAPHSSVDSVEHDMIDPHNEIVMDANDQIAIPLKLRWLQPTTTSTTHKPAASMSLAVRSCTHGHTIALFKLDLFPQPFVCHRVLRFVSPANSVWKWTVRCPQGKHLVCLDASVAAVVEATPTGSCSLVTLKCRVGAYPSLEDFFVVVYDDEYFARLDEIWQIRIQSAMRLDVHTLLGQTVTSELVIKGDHGAKNRHVKCATTWHHAGLVSFRPADIFQLVTDAYNRIEWRFCATDLPSSSLCRVRVHLVDVETHELVGAWLLHVSLGRPTVTKSYELRLPRAQAAQKKIAYTNPWDQPQTVVLRSSDPMRMRPRDRVLQIPAQGQIFLRLVFPAPERGAGNAEGELLLFVNDQQTEQSEECLRFHVCYT
jgi:Ca2+-binding EF-hand superfamily protein